MAYLALYRKYRPTSFDDVIDQDHITKTLENQVKTGQISHAYLFVAVVVLARQLVQKYSPKQSTV